MKSTRSAAFRWMRTAVIVLAAAAMVAWSVDRAEEAERQARWAAQMEELQPQIDLLRAEQSIGVATGDATLITNLSTPNPALAPAPDPTFTDRIVEQSPAGRILPVDQNAMWIFSTDANFSVSTRHALPEHTHKAVLGLAISLVVLSGMSFGRGNYGRKPAKLALSLCAPFTVLGAIGLTTFNSNLNFWIHASSALVPFGLALFVGAMMRARRTPRYGWQIVGHYVRFSAGLTIAWTSIYVLVDTDYLSPPWANVAYVAAMLAAFIGLPKALKLDDTPIPEMFELYSNDNSVSGREAIGSAIACGLTLLVALTFIVLLGWSSLASVLIWFVPMAVTTWLVTRLHYDSLEVYRHFLAELHRPAA